MLTNTRRKVYFTVGSGILLLLISYGTLKFLFRTKITVDGKSFTDYTLKEQTVKNVLDSFNIEVSSNDIVRPPLTDKVRWGQNIRVIRVRESVEEKKEVVNFILKWKRRISKNFGRKVEIQHGSKQITTWTVRHVYHDEKEVESKPSKKKVKKVIGDRIVLLNPKGYPEKIYDLSLCKKIPVIATAYWEGDPQVPGVETFSGHRVERGLVAVDPTVIPLGWRIYVPGYGYGYTSDTGSAIKGDRIDLFVESKKASRKWEYVKVTVYLLEKSQTW